MQIVVSICRRSEWIVIDRITRILIAVSRKIADTHSGFTLASTVAYKIRIKRYKISIRNVVSVENDENHEKEIAHIDYSVTQSCHQIRLLKYEIVWDKAENQMPRDEVKPNRSPCFALSLWQSTWHQSVLGSNPVRRRAFCSLVCLRLDANQLHEKLTPLVHHITEEILILWATLHTVLAWSVTRMQTLQSVRNRNCASLFLWIPILGKTTTL